MQRDTRLPILVAAVACWLTVALNVDASFAQGSKSSSKASSSSRNANSKSAAKKSSKSPSKVVAKAPQPIAAEAGAPRGFFAKVKAFFGFGGRRSRPAPGARGNLRSIADSADMDIDADNGRGVIPARGSLRRNSSEMSLVDSSDAAGGPVVEPAKPLRPAPNIGPEENIYSNFGLRVSGGGVRNSGTYVDVGEPLAGAEVAAAAVNVAAGKPYDTLQSLANMRQSAGRAPSSRQSLSRNSASARQPGSATIDLVSALPLPPAPNSPRNSVNLRVSGRQSSNGAQPLPPLPLPPLPRGSGNGFSNIQ